ncbi:MAG: GxxExxY protein [Bacteroidales bacterium]|jgi:GxxExxY protein|nr:GxxExxY protein [Bacteroidales bacterium]
MDIPENEISYSIRGSVFKVYNNLGPGLLESVYELVLAHELEKAGHIVKTQIGIPLVYDGIKIDQGFRLDILVDDLVIIEVKSVEELNPVHFKQLTTYLKLSEKKLGLLINFNTDDIKSSIRRIVNGI